MSVLDDVLVEEYERCERIKQAFQEELRELPEGYLSRKVIKGKEYFYLQRREGKKIVSQYVRKEDVEQLQKQLEIRKGFQKGLQELEESQRKIRRVVGSLVDRSV